ncbi:GAF domain-containing protein, partial [Candidatus Bathyarchaeota archaeon]|nr:GAF domain-containing protein [Candidatus Bathyarchaeota archaeon]MBT7185802.1 GAF domain-containing protein [Candidatus Bathyarchaeota archaeon]
RYIWGAEPIQNSFTRLDGPGIIVEVVKTGKTQNIGDVRENPLYIAGFSGEVILSELAVPVMISGKAIGVLNLESDALDAYSENDQRLVETLASHVASAFSKIKYNERMNELYEFSIELGTTESVNEVVATSLRIMREVFGFQFSSFQLLDEDGLVSVGTTDNSNLGVVFPLSGKGITTRAARDKRTMLVGDVSLDPDYIKWSMDSRSELAVPIMREDRVLGVLNVESLTFEAFSDDDARLLELLAQNVEAALYRVRSVADRKQVTDALLLSEERLSGFMESATESFILLDSELNILDANPTWLKLTGFSQTVIGKNLQNVLPANDIMSSRYSAYKRVIETGQPIEFNQTVSPSNENVFYDVKAFKVDDGVGVIVTDVTEQTIAKQMLEASESRFRGLFENLIVGYGHQQMVYDEQGKPVDYIFLAGNEAFEQFTGLVLDDIIGKRVTEVLPGIENDPANWIGIYGKIASEGGSTFFEQFVESLGMWYKIQVYSTEKGYFTTIFENITDRKRTEQELEALARFPGENTNPVLRINNEGTILYANRTATQELTGWAPKIGDEVSGEGLSIVTSTLSSGEKSVYERVYGDRVFSFILAPIVESGYVNVYGRDVTEELRLETRIKTIQTHANELSNTSNTIEIAQKSLNIIKTSLGFNYSSFQIVEGDELVTLEYFDDTYPEGGNRSEFLRLPISGKGITTKVVRERKTILINDLSEDPDFIKGSMDSSLSELAVPIISEGTVIGVLNIESPELGGFNEADARVLEVLSQNVGSALFRIQAVEDRLELERQLISEQIRVEQEHELGELKDQFIATATHELRTPVTSILGYIELIMEDPNRIISDPVRKDLNVVLRNSHRLVSFVNDLLDVQRITAGKLEAKLEPADLVSALDQVVGEMSHLFSEKDQVLRVEAPERVVMSVDEPRVSQLFINLLRNANKFTPKGGQVTVSVEPEENHVRVSVKDSGVGLSVEDIGKLFVPFPSINRELGGTSTGLGLAICKGIVDMHGGEIWAESEGHGKGSTFTFTLPIEK